MKSWGEQQQFPTEVLSETEHLKAENQKLKERIAVLESEVERTNQLRAEYLEYRKALGDWLQSILHVCRDSEKSESFALAEIEMLARRLINA